MVIIDRELIIQKIKETLEPLDYVYAMWLEGADANGHLDEYSDIDINIDVEDEYETNVFEIVEGLFELDYKHDNSGNGKQKQKVYHIKDTSEFLMIDFNLQPHSCSSENSTFKYGDIIDVNVILFDKAGVVRYEEAKPLEYAEDHKYWLAESAYRYSQICRVRKYILRNQYPEAFIYYHKYVIEPMVMLIRMKYTPSKLWYYMVHISRHIPEDALIKLNKLLQVSSVDDIGNNLDFAVQWYRELIKELQ
ncbi:MAG: hypothetical protein ACYCWE_04135 [Eubacteriales bacterium]